MLKKLLAVLMVVCLLPVAALAQTDAERIAALEERVAALEEALAALQGGETAEKQPEEARRVEESFPAAESVQTTVAAWDFLSRFNYYPSGSYFSRTLSAANGYVLVAVYLDVKNDSAEDFMVSSLLDATLTYGEEYSGEAENTFFYRQSQNVYATGLRAIGARASASGCLLFALPEEAYRGDGEITLRFQAGGTTYVYTLRGQQNTLPVTGDEITF